MEQTETPRTRSRAKQQTPSASIKGDAPSSCWPSTTLAPPISISHIDSSNPPNSPKDQLWCGPTAVVASFDPLTQEPKKNSLEKENLERLLVARRVTPAPMRQRARRAPQKRVFSSPSVVSTACSSGATTRSVWVPVHPSTSLRCSSTSPLRFSSWRATRRVITRSNGTCIGWTAFSRMCIIDASRISIVPRHLQLAIRNDEELNKLLGGVVISQGGVVPHIAPELLCVFSSFLCFFLTLVLGHTQRRRVVRND